LNNRRSFAKKIKIKFRLNILAKKFLGIFSHFGQKGRSTEFLAIFSHFGQKGRSTEFLVIFSHFGQKGRSTEFWLFFHILDYYF